MSENEKEVQLVEWMRDAHQKILTEISKVIVGQQEIVDQLLIALFAHGYSIIIGVPGLAKTLMINTLSHVLDLKFQRIQFTPDLMPSDITGTDIIEEDKTTGNREFRFVKGPVFANIILADEINRTPPKTQAALLQAMQEYAVTAGGKTYELKEPFFVLATQNPIEQEGTYPLPEAQLDRFMFSLNITYPQFHEEVEIIKNTTSAYVPDPQKVLKSKEVLDLQKVVRNIPVAEHLVELAVNISKMTRPSDKLAPEFIKNWIEWGAGPRASQYIILGAKANAIINGRYFVTTEDIFKVIKPVLRHRIITNFNAEADGVNVEGIIDKLMIEIEKLTK
ncbi:MAG: MoxR family ATPase [bacterium]|nr:MoxR family ATPase [bacterium]